MCCKWCCHTHVPGRFDRLLLQAGQKVIDTVLDTLRRHPPAWGPCTRGSAHLAFPRVSSLLGPLQRPAPSRPTPHSVVSAVTRGNLLLGNSAGRGRDLRRPASARAGPAVEAPPLLGPRGTRAGALRAGEAHRAQSGRARRLGCACVAAEDGVVRGWDAQAGAHARWEAGGGAGAGGRVRRARCPWQLSRSRRYV